MKLLLLLVAIYSLIFYQHYKIEKSKTSLPDSEPKAGKYYQDYNPIKREDFGSVAYFSNNHYLMIPNRAIARYKLYE